MADQKSLEKIESELAVSSEEYRQIKLKKQMEEEQRLYFKRLFRNTPSRSVRSQDKKTPRFFGL